MPSFHSPNGTLHFEQRGSRAATPVLMIHGLGCQLIHWPDSLLDGLVSAGLRVIFWDNRDVGLSFEVDADPPTIADLLAAQSDPSVLSPSYSLSEMAEDAIHLLNHLGQSGAHIVGVSMGGMIAQRLAMHHSHRVFSMTTLMSSTGNPNVGNPNPEAVAALAGSFVANDREAIIQATVAAGNLFGGERYPSERFGIARFAELGYDRSNRPNGTLRQLSAIMTDGDRTAQLRKVDIPTLVIHGTVDPLVHHSGSEALAEALPQSELVLIDDLGHDLSEPVVPSLVESIVQHIGGIAAPR